jgi:outer membrane immunogenic protein
LTSAAGTNLDGIVGGGQIGYNWQMQNWVWGLEADIQGTGEKGSRPFAYLPAPIIGNNFAPTVAVPFALSQKIDWFGTVRGRAGVLVDPKVLLYVTGGLAYGAVNTSEAIGVVPVYFSKTDTRFGYTVGAGIEGVIGGNWTAKLEYLWVDLGKTSGSFLTPLVAPGGGFLTSNFSSRITDNVLRVGVNYKFGGPVVARY